MNDGEMYVGEMKSNLRHGRGVYTYANGYGVFEGTWENDRREGVGIMTFKNSDVYVQHYTDEKCISSVLTVIFS
jgi:hypothetical protein